MAKRKDQNAAVLLSFTGFHDPFSPGPVSGHEQEGPVLSLVRSFPVDDVILFSTAKTRILTDETEKALRDRHSHVKVEVRHLLIDDPTDYLAILTSLRAEFAGLSKHRKDAAYFVATASGTPQMHACWVLLVASGEVPGRLLHVRPPQFVAEKKPAVTEVDLARPEFPTIRSKLWADIQPPEDATRRPAEIIEQLGIIGDHPAIVQALETASLLARSDAPVLILGESGTGKEKMASLIHHLSDRASKPFIAVNCAAIPDQLAESTLFGHKKGAFTGANADLHGKFDAANHGTLFLDEVGELSQQVQAKLLRAVQEGVIEPPGEPKGHAVNVRLVAATNRELKQLVANGKFREDLYYRLKVGEVQLPALRERRSDISKLAISILDEINRTLRKPRRFAPEALAALHQHDWPGNVRELRNVVHRAALLVKGDEIKRDHLDLPKEPTSAALARLPEPHEGFSLDDYLKQVRKQLFQRALALAGGAQSEAARLLGVTPQAVHKFLKGGEQ